MIRGVEVSSKEVVDHTGSPRQHVLLGRTERETGTDRAGSTAQRCVFVSFLLSFSIFSPFSLLLKMSLWELLCDKMSKRRSESADSSKTRPTL